MLAIQFSIQTIAALMQICSFVAPNAKTACYKEVYTRCSVKVDTQKCVNEFVRDKLDGEDLQGEMLQEQLDVSGTSKALPAYPGTVIVPL